MCYNRLIVVTILFDCRLFTVIKLQKINNHQLKKTNIMRKVIFMIALIVGASLTTVNATEKNSEKVSNKVEVTSIVKVNPFCIAIAKGDFDTVKRMIQFGENVNKKSNGKTPLMYAARYNRVKIASLLLDNGAKLSPRDNNGQTAIDYAKQAKAKEVQKVLEASK